MRKRILLVTMILALVLFTSSCSLVVKDEAVDMETTIVEVAGKTITKGEIINQQASVLDYQAMLYSAYGIPFDPNDPETIASAQQTTIDSLIQSAVLEQKASEMGMDVLTEEETAKIETDAQNSYDSYLKQIEMSQFASSELEGDERTAAIEAVAVENGITMDALMADAKALAIDTKLKDEVVKDVAVTEEETSAEYDTRVANSQSTYEATPANYGTDVKNGTAVYYAPAGYRYVKNLLVSFAKEDLDKINTLTADLNTKQAALSENEASIAALSEEATDEEKDALNATKETLVAEVADLQAQLDAANAAATEAIQPKVDEVTTALAAEDADFDALLTQYGEDAGAAASPEGYLVCATTTTYVPAFTEAAMALANVGDVSGAVSTNYGVHFLQYAGDLAEGAVAYDDVKEAITSELLTAKQDSLYSETVETWVEEAGAKIDADRLN